MLFDAGKCFEIECFTKHCMNVLQGKDLLIVFGEGTARSLEITATCRAGALGHVRQCCTVAREAVKAEFPHFDVIMAFKIFSLNEADGMNLASPEKRQAVQRLCQVWEEDFEQVWPEFQQIYRIALTQKKHAGSNNREAWQWAMRRAKQTRWPVAHLEPLVCAYICFTASSSGVEQVFSRLDRSHLQQGRRRGRPQTFARTVQVLGFQGDENSINSIIQKARSLFAIGRNRNARNIASGRLTRIDKGSAGKTKNIDSEAGWLRKRKHSLQTAVNHASAGSGALPVMVGPSHLPEKMQKECDRQQKLTLKRRLEAHEDGHLLADEMPEAEDIEEQRKRHCKNDAKRKTDEKKLASKVNMVSKIQSISAVQNHIRGSILWFPSATAIQRQQAINFGSHAVQTSLENAHVFVVDSSNPQPRAMWHAVLTGGVVISENFFSKSERSGFCLVYSAAVKTRLALVLTHGFRAKNQKLTQCFEDLTTKMLFSKWEIYDSTEDARARSQPIICLCRDEEEKKTRKAPKINCLTAKDFLVKLQKKNCNYQRSGQWKFTQGT